MKIKICLKRFGVLYFIMNMLCYYTFLAINNNNSSFKLVILNFSYLQIHQREALNQNTAVGAAGFKLVYCWSSDGHDENVNKHVFLFLYFLLVLLVIRIITFIAANPHTVSNTQHWLVILVMIYDVFYFLFLSSRVMWEKFRVIVVILVFRVHSCMIK